ncbi:MAG: hypothetical protein HUU57_00650 [Bdellovibrio sp.]|nr:hypothetical protein [Bdellovibrio sp.]
MKTLAARLIILFTFLSPLYTLAASKRICTMTLNSVEEREVLKNLYGGKDVEITELVPESKDPSWLAQACKSGIECDVLLVSGHFGGVFFGEGVGTTLDLKELERLSCENSCPGILSKPKDVFLMGCNTLATKVPDKRSIEEYVEVLIKNGFPRDLAERVAFSRYSEYGMSISQIFSSAFQNVERLHGFASTSPLGKYSGPLMRQALKGTSAETLFSQGPDLNKFKQAFAGVGYRIVNPAQDMDKNYKNLTCKALSQSTEQNQEAIQFLSKKIHLKKYYEPLLEAVNNPTFIKLLKSTMQTSSEARTNFESFFQEISAARSLPLKMKFQFLNLQESLGLIPPVVKNDQQEILIATRLAEGLNFIVTDQFCAMKDLLQNTELRGEWILLNSTTKQFIPRLAQCFGSFDKKIEAQLKSMTLTTDVSLRREAIRAVKDRLSFAEKDRLVNASTDWSQRDRIDMAYNLSLFLENELLPANLESCLSAANKQDSADSRDGYRWGCYKDFEEQIDSPMKCQQVARQFETQSVTGLDWQCLTRFTTDIHLNVCIEAASRNADPENSDDVRWFCWNKLSMQKQLSRSECLGLASSMKIQGNRFKANWNCMNRIN